MIVLAGSELWSSDCVCTFLLFNPLPHGRASALPAEDDCQLKTCSPHMLDESEALDRLGFISERQLVSFSKAIRFASQRQSQPC